MRKFRVALVMVLVALILQTAVSVAILVLQQMQAVQKEDGNSLNL